MRTTAWGADITPGAEVTTHGRHGVGQPVVTGRVRSVDGQTVIIETPNGVRRRTIANVRRVNTADRNRS